MKCRVVYWLGEIIIAGFERETLKQGNGNSDSWEMKFSAKATYNFIIFCEKRKGKEKLQSITVFCCDRKVTDGQIIFVNAIDKNTIPKVELYFHLHVSQSEEFPMNL